MDPNVIGSVKDENKGAKYIRKITKRKQSPSKANNNKPLLKVPTEAELRKALINLKLNSLKKNKRAKNM